MKHSDPLLILIDTHDADPEHGTASPRTPQAQALMERVLAEPRPTPGRRAAAPSVRPAHMSWPRRLAIVGAGLAVLGAGTLGAAQLRSSVPPALVASGVTGFVTQTEGCSVRNATTQEAAGATSFLSDVTLPLFRVDAVWTSGCSELYGSMGWPGATYLRVGPDSSTLTGALAFWPDVNVNEETFYSAGTTTEVSLGTTTATLLDLGDLMYTLTWGHGEATWRITSSGVELGTVLDLAETVETSGATSALPVSVDGLEMITLDTRPTGPAALVDLSYTRQVEDETSGEAVFLTLRPTAPWEATVSIGTYLGDGDGSVELVDVGDALGLAVNNGTADSPSFTFTWNLPTGQTARLWGSGDLDDFVGFAHKLEKTDATDPRIVDNLNRREPFIGR